MRCGPTIFGRQAEVDLPPGFDPPSAALVTSVPPRPKPTGETRAGDLRYNIMVRLGNMGCTCPVDHLDTEALTEHWESHCRAGRPQRFGLGAASWIEVTTMGSREREWIPRHPLRHPPQELADPSFCLGCGKDLSWCGCEVPQPSPPRPARSTLLARQYDRVGGPGRAEAEAEKIASRSCADCGMDDEPLTAGRCRFCAELTALRRPRQQEAPYGIWMETESTAHHRPWATGRMAVLAVVAVLLLALAGFAGVAIGLGMSGL